MYIYIYTVYTYIKIYYCFYRHTYIHTLHYITLHDMTLHYITWHDMTWHDIPYHTIPYYTIPYHTIPYHTIQYNTIQYNTYIHTYIHVYPISRRFPILDGDSPHFRLLSQQTGAPSSSGRAVLQVRRWSNGFMDPEWRALTEISRDKSTIQQFMAWYVTIMTVYQL